MIRRTQLTLLFAIETLLFVVASLFHVRALFVDYEYGRAAIAEDVIRAALALGLVASLMQPASTPLVAHAVQGFALLGSLVGTFTIAVGVGPRTHADIVFHVILLLVLIVGIIGAWEKKRSMSQPTTS